MVEHKIKDKGFENAVKTIQRKLIKLDVPLKKVFDVTKAIVVLYEKSGGK